jgi:Spy/CpxP family protein refolding chaperone
MKKNLIFTGIMGIFLLVGSVGLAAENPHPGGPGHPGYHRYDGNGPGRDLGLTSEQKAKLKELRWKFDEETAQLRGTLLTKRLELRSLWRNPKADPKAILDKEKELRDVQNQLRDKAIQHRLEARKILTPEQIEKMGSGWERGFGRRHRMGEGGGMGHGMGGGMGLGMEHGMGPGMGRMGHGMGRNTGMCD